MQTMTWQGPGGTVTLAIDFRGAETHKECVRRVEDVLAAGAQTIKQRAKANAAGITSALVDPRAFGVDRVKAKGKNITNKTDKFNIWTGTGVYPGTPKKHPLSALAKPAHAELGTTRRAKTPFVYPAFDETKGEILSDLENCV